MDEYETKTGRKLTEGDIEAFTKEAEQGYDVSQIPLSQIHPRPRLEHTLMGTTDAMVWAEEFCRIFNGKPVSMDESQGVGPGTMVTWFANAIEVGRDAGKKIQPGPWHAFLHFYHLDKSNAAFHCADVRFSPVTFRLAEYLQHTNSVEALMSSELADVAAHMGEYEEDAGR